MKHQDNNIQYFYIVAYTIVGDDLTLCKVVVIKTLIKVRIILVNMYNYRRVKYPSFNTFHYENCYIINYSNYSLF